MLSHTVPSDELLPEEFYMWRVRVTDSSDWIALQNLGPRTCPSQKSSKVNLPAGLEDIYISVIDPVPVFEIGMDIV